jgi:hypothetical protein
MDGVVGAELHVLAIVHVPATSAGSSAFPTLVPVWTIAFAPRQSQIGESVAAFVKTPISLMWAFRVGALKLA